MLKLIIDKLPRILKNKKNLEKELGVKISNRGKEVYVDGEPEKEFVAEKIIQALDFGFPYSSALTIKQEDSCFEIINIKDHTNRKDLERIRARIIGKKGKTLKTISELTKCFFEIKDNFIGIIADPELIKNAQEAVISLIKGSKQGNVYSFLEKNQPKPEFDLGLKK